MTLLPLSGLGPGLGHAAQRLLLLRSSPGVSESLVDMGPRPYSTPTVLGPSKSRRMHVVRAKGTGCTCQAEGHPWATRVGQTEELAGFLNCSETRAGTPSRATM